jgi:hypothetical protein
MPVHSCAVLALDAHDGVVTARSVRTMARSGHHGDALDAVEVSALVDARYYAPAVGLMLREGALNGAARCRCAPPAMLALTWVWLA